MHGVAAGCMELLRNAWSINNSIIAYIHIDITVHIFSIQYLYLQKIYSYIDNYRVAP
jgi:hypothetical protein